MLRDYQQLAVDHVNRELRRGHRRLYFSLPTGCGKTAVLGELARHLASTGRVLLLVHRTELVAQLREALDRAGLWPGVVMAGQDDTGSRVLVATVQTLGPKRLAVLLSQRETFAGILIDEAHHLPAASYVRVIDQVAQHSPDVAVVGCTATPFRSDGGSMQSVLPVCAFVRSIADMQAAGWLAPLTWRRLPVAIDLRHIATTSASGERDYRPEQLAAALNCEPITAAIVGGTLPLVGQRPTVVFAADVAHAQALAAAYAAIGVPAAAVWGDMPPEQRARTLAAWRGGAVQLVANCALLTEGFDFPELAAVVMARPTQSAVLYTQALGRGTRLAAGKDDCLVVDVTGNANLADTRQIVLASIADGLIAEGTDPAVPQPRKPSGYRILDPLGKSPFAWAELPTGEYAVSLTRLETAVLLREPSGSGLYLPVVHSRSKLRPLVQPVTADPVPLREAVQHVHAALTKAGQKPPFAAKSASWRDGPASAAAFTFLGTLDATLARQAIAERWTAGRVSEAIDAAKTVRVLPLLREHCFPLSHRERCS
ncbi:MAG TPA: DEAD/DEAH box helicase [Chloroflexota bacterium]|nr:DEAD/DEAH box helicase [Chloroflexota bacterium]